MELNIQLTIEETNLILGALAEFPFKMVNELVQKISSQANNQISTQQTIIPNDESVIE